MSKVKSVIITVLLMAAIIVAAFFATVSYPTGENQRYNSMVSSIPLGADYSGYAYTTLYPEQIITTNQYNILDEDEQENYIPVEPLKIGMTKPDRQYSNLYYHREYKKDEISSSVIHDAEVLAGRFGRKGYSGYNVAVEADYTIRLSVPTNFTYADYRKNNDQTRDQAILKISPDIVYLTAAGEFTLRTPAKSIPVDNSSTFYPYTDSYTNKAKINNAPSYSLIGVNECVSDIFESVTNYTINGIPVISFNLSKSGREKIKTLSTIIAGASDSNTQAIYGFLGSTPIISIQCTSTIDLEKIELQAESEQAAENMAISIDSAIHGEYLEMDYGDLTSILYSTAAGGDNAAMFALIACLSVMVVLIVISLVKFKKLGIVYMLMIILFALVIIYAMYILQIMLTAAVLLAALVGFMLLCVSNMIVFSAVKKYVETGRTMQASVKEGYKKTLMSVADMHIVLFIVSLIIALVAVGETAACGFVMLISTIASYVLYWFTRFMWYVLSSQYTDKFGFAGLTRVVYDED